MSEKRRASSAVNLALQTKFPAHRVVPVASLTPYANNARTHSAEQIAKISESIRQFGFTNPILVDADNGIIAGHGRLRAALFLGMDSVPVIDLAHLSATQRQAYILADNRLALDAGWDDDRLRFEIGELQTAGFDVGLTGFDPGDIATLFGDKEAPDDFESYDERIPTEHQCPKCGFKFSGNS